MRVAYKVFPFAKPNPVFPGQTYTWVPILNVHVLHNHARSKRVEAVVDSGSPWRLFHADVGSGIGIDVTEGIERPMGGVVGGAKGRCTFTR